MDSQNKVARGKPELNDAELIGALLFLSALSKASSIESWKEA